MRERRLKQRDPTETLLEFKHGPQKGWRSVCLPQAQCLLQTLAWQEHAEAEVRLADPCLAQSPLPASWPWEFACHWCLRPVVRSERSSDCFQQGDTMTLQRSQFLKSCSEMGWRKDRCGSLGHLQVTSAGVSPEDVRGMWQKMDKDSNGCVTLEEFDYESAQADCAYCLARHT